MGKQVLAGIIDKEADISVIKGTDVYASTEQAVKVLGGIEKFVPQGASVGLLINAGFEQKGAYVHPDISLATLQMCIDAGASEVISLQFIEPAYWERSENYTDKAGYVEKLKQVETNIYPAEFNEDDWLRIPKIEGSKTLEEVEVIKALELKVLERADVVFAVSDVLHERKSKLNENCYLALHGVDLERFEAVSRDEIPTPSDMASIPGPIVGFIGFIEEWIDIDLLHKIG